MLVVDALSEYPDEDLDRLARDKVEEVANLRLPRQVLIQEIAAALSSLSYVAQVLAPTRPPTYAFLKLLMEAPEQRIPPHGFREAVQSLTDELTEQARSCDGLSKEKDYPLYLRMLYAAWEDDGRVDRSEALLLAALRKELGIWTREHLLLEHHPVVRPLWDSERAYAEVRNALLSTGLVLIHGGEYLLPDEVAVQIRRTWEIDLGDAAYRRLLGVLIGHQLRDTLAAVSLPVSGSKEERIERIIRGLIPPAEVLDTLHINDVKDLCRTCSLAVSGPKADLIAKLVDHFDTGRDVARAESLPEVLPTAEPELRQLDDNQLTKLLANLTIDLLHDILDFRNMPRTGSKQERIERLLASPFSEYTLLDSLRRVELSELCRRLGIPISGVKSEIIGRLVTWAQAPAPIHAEMIDAMIPASMESAAGKLGAELAQEPPRPSALAGGGTKAPSNVPEIRHRFQHLDEAEEIILALLKEARSLNEREIERAVQHHRLGWFLTKAQMAELIAKLRMRSDEVVRVRSTGGLNIYEWVESHHEDQLDRGFDRGAARDVIDALRQGVVPERHLDLLVVGQEETRAHLLDLLGNVARGRSEFKFLRGAYGAGKSFLCGWLREQAFDLGFATAMVRIGPDQPLSELPVFFSGLIAGLRTPEKRDASALADVLEAWLLGIHRETARGEGFVANGVTDREALLRAVESRIDQELAELAQVGPGFAAALRAFYKARLQADHETAAVALSWLRGSRALSASALSTIGVRGQLASDEVFPRMRALLKVIVKGRLRGLLLVLDELELVRRFPHARQRERAYETLRLLIDESGENGLPGCMLVCTGTDQLFEDERYGLASYQALAHRVCPPQASNGPLSVRQPIVSLAPLDQELLLEVALRVRKIHGLAYDWDAQGKVGRSVLERMVADWTLFGESHAPRLPRPFLREIVHLLDLCEERPGLPAEDYLKGPVDRGSMADSVLSCLED